MIQTATAPRIDPITLEVVRNRLAVIADEMEEILLRSSYSPIVKEGLDASAALFTIGVVGVLTKRNVISMFMCIELMLNAVNLTFVSFSSFFHDVSGQLFVFIVMTVAAAEAAVGLGIIISIFRNRESLDVDDSSVLKL